MVKLFPALTLSAVLLIGLAASEITVTFEPYNETEEATLYGRNSENLHSIGDSQDHDEEEVEVFYRGSDGDENRGDIPTTQTHSPIQEPNDPENKLISISKTVEWRLPEPAKQCPRCCQQPGCTAHPPTYVNYANHPLFPSWGGGGSHAPIIDDEAEYINGGGGGQQIIFVTQPQPQQPDFPHLPELAPSPEFSPQQPSRPSIFYIPYQPSTPNGPSQLPGFDNVPVEGHIGGGFNGHGISGNGIDDGFNQDSAHRNHEQIWKLHQQQHQLWLQRQRQQQHNQFNHLVIGGGGISSIGNTGSLGPLNGGGQRPCDSKKY